MRKIPFEVGDRVFTVEDNKVVYGEIHEIIGGGSQIVVVKLEDGSLCKMFYHSLAKVQENTETESEPVEKSEVTITPDEFRKVSAKVVADILEGIDNTDQKLEYLLLSSVLMTKIHCAIFYS